MIQLHNLKKHPKSTHRKKVVGRGIGSGHGTYATRGNKGQTKRTGHSKIRVGFEGGRQPLIRQMPKARGFKSLSEKAYPLSLDKLNIFSDGDTVNLKTLRDKGLVDAAVLKVKVLAAGKLTKKISVKLPVSASAKQAIEKAGGAVL